ncbi:MAG: hypothetical protein SWO11_07090 [Thermodesulfobacteriota bacterium]|nr:hypothetical protein [Thermodesulfobacteriota bacterium]
MRKRPISKNSFAVFLITIILITSIHLQKAYAEKTIIARLTSFKGYLNVTRDDTALPPVVNMPLLNNDRIKIVDGTATIQFPEGSILRLLPRTEIIMKETKKKRKTGIFKRSYTSRFIEVISGKLWADIIPKGNIETEIDTGISIIQLNEGSVEISIGFATGTVSVGCSRGRILLTVVIAGVTYVEELTSGQYTNIISGIPPTVSAPYISGAITRLEPLIKKRVEELVQKKVPAPEPTIEPKEEPLIAIETMSLSEQTAPKPIAPVAPPASASPSTP